MIDWTDEFIKFATEERVAAILEEDPYLDNDGLVERLKHDMIEETLLSLEEKGLVTESRYGNYYPSDKGTEVFNKIEESGPSGYCGRCGDSLFDDNTTLCSCDYLDTE